MPTSSPESWNYLAMSSRMTADRGGATHPVRLVNLHTMRSRGPETKQPRQLNLRREDLSGSKGPEVSDGQRSEPYVDTEWRDSGSLRRRGQDRALVLFDNTVDGAIPSIDAYLCPWLSSVPVGCSETIAVHVGGHV
jgi:hypothetical protein